MYNTFIYRKRYYLLIVFCFYWLSFCQVNDSLFDIEIIERLYKRDFINQIKNEMLKEALSKDKSVDKQQVEKIEVVASNAYSNLSQQLITLKEQIKTKCQKQKRDKSDVPKELYITFSLIQIDNVITATIEHIDPPNSVHEKSIRKIFDDFAFSPIPLYSHEIKLQLSVKLSE